MKDSEAKELEAARNMMQHAVANYCKLKEVEDAVEVIMAVESKIERQLHKEEQIAELDKKILAEAGPVNAAQFFNLCSNWSWNLNVAEVANELGSKHGFDSSECYWDLYGELFVLFFSNNENQEKEQKEYWETIGYIMSEFCDSGICF